MSSGPLSLVTPGYASYNLPQKSGVETAPDSFSVVTPSGNTVFHAGDKIDLQISSSQRFLRPKKCWLSYNVKFNSGTSSVSDASLKTTFAGLAAGTIAQISTDLNGVNIETIQDYNLMLAIAYNKLPNDAKSVLAELEGYGRQTDLGTSGGTTYGIPIAHNLRGSLWEGDTLLPLPIVKKMTLSVSLGQISQLVSQFGTGTTKATDFQITNVKLHLCYVNVAPEYVSQWVQSLRSGKIASIPLKLTRSIPTAMPASVYQNLPLQLGSLASVDSFTAVIRDATNINTAVSSKTSSEVDENRCFDFSKVQNWYLSMSDGTRYPSDVPIGETLANDPYGLTMRVESLAYLLASIDMSYAHINILSPGGSTPILYDGMLHYAFEPSPTSFGEGLKCNDGNLSVMMELKSTYTNNSRLQVFLTYDAMLQIDAETITVSKSGF